MSAGTTIILVSALIFGSVALAVVTLTNVLAHRGRVRRRFGAVSTAGSAATLDGDARDSRTFEVDPARLGLDAQAQRDLRRGLIRAGFFSPDGVVIFTLARLALLVLLPVIGYLAVAATLTLPGATEKAALALVLLIVAYYLPRAYLSRRERLLQDKYRVTFPDLLDMLVVCVNAGLSLEAALDRAARELGPEDAELRANFDLMAGEMRAGRSTSEALRDCAERLGLREARSFAGLLQQTLELGTDVALALTTFSDEMREKRMSRAEEKAASLPPKLTLPLGICIFPVVLIVVLAPAVLRVMGALQP